MAALRLSGRGDRFPTQAPVDFITAPSSRSEHHYGLGWIILVRLPLSEMPAIRPAWPKAKA
jgi:hypothetical protein